MKCCKCNKEVNIDPTAKENRYPPPQWFGMYIADELKRLICADCIQKAENKDWWK